MDDAQPASLLIAEHSHDPSGDLQGDGWHGVMNYAAFTRPLWQWLKPDGTAPFESGPFTIIPRLTGTDIVATMREFAAASPWRSTTTALNLIGSHDTARILTTLADEELVKVAFGLLAAMPGIPMVYAGDEIGQEGENGEDGRRPFPWHRENDWNFGILEWVRAVLLERKSVPALRTGGLRWVSVTDDALTFLREADDESILVHATRGESGAVRLPADYFGRHLAGLAGSEDLTAEDDQLTLPSSGPGFYWWRLG
jgi:alpha-glucosidase